MASLSPESVEAYHAHVYFDAETAGQARTLREEIEARFDIRMGRFHEKPVGPHPCWSYQVAFDSPLFGDIVSWLSLNRRGLTVFVHACTGNDMRDHVNHVCWLGESCALNLDIFREA